MPAFQDEVRRAFPEGVPELFFRSGKRRRRLRGIFRRNDGGIPFKKTQPFEENPVGGPCGRRAGSQKRAFSPGQAGSEDRQPCFPRQPAGFLLILLQQSFMPRAGMGAEQEAGYGRRCRGRFRP